MSRFILIIMLIAPCVGFTQTRKLTGSVVAFNKFPLNQISVKAKKAKTETTTDDRGRFEIEVKKNDQIRIEEPGFFEYRTKVSNSEKTVRINLIYLHSDENMEKVTQGAHISKTDLIYGLDHLARQNNVFGQFHDVFDAIKYAIPTATITIWDGRRGVEFREYTTPPDSSPFALMVVDGQITEDIGFLSPSNIIRIEKLENTVTEVHGVRADNGVIAITTQAR